MNTDFSEKWHLRFLGLTEVIAGWSKDPSRGVGCVIVSPNRQIISTGFNGLPRGVDDLPERLERPTKYDLIVHAEMNAIIQCARNGISPIGCVLYSSFFPCVNCAIAIVQAGLDSVVTIKPDATDEHWINSINKSRVVLEEAGVNLVELEMDALTQ
ncbi:MAG: dCMP deaminase family protein [Phycisphaerales bacterium]|nr:dCMP deaminase family protein [Phycisphaerales bacterium]